MKTLSGVLFNEHLQLLASSSSSHLRFNKEGLQVFLWKKFIKQRPKRHVLLAEANSQGFHL